MAPLTTSWLVACAAVFSACVPLAAAAVRVNGVATGVIDDFDTRTEGEGAAVFGLDQSELPGTPFRIDFSYDTALAPPDSNSHPERNLHQSEDGAAPDWLDLAITVNGHTVVLREELRFADIWTSDEDDYFQLGVEFSPSQPEDPDVGVHRREYLAFSVSLPARTLTSSELPAQFASDEIERHVNSANFSIDDFDFDRTSGELVYAKIVEFGLDIRHISASPVPEPDSAALLIAGLLALGARARPPRS